MTPTLKRLAVLAALGTVGFVAPATGASAAVTPSVSSSSSLPASQLPLTGLPGAAGFPFPATGVPAAPDLPAFAPVPSTLITPGLGQVAAVIGPTIITTAPSTFINTNNQVSAGSNASGGQATP